MSYQIQLRSDTAANWTSVNPTLAQAEVGRESDTNQIKVGDGVTAWNSLAYSSWTLVSPAFTGNPTAPTQTRDNNSTRLATTAYADRAGSKRVLALSAGSATPAINTDNTDIVHITAQSAAITSFTTNLTGTPVDGDEIFISITDDGTARAITWGTKFEAGIVPLPVTTVISTRLDTQFVWNTVTSKWRTAVANVITQAALDNSTNIATTAYTDAAVTAYKSATATETNKRITKRVLALSAASATPAINTDSYDVVHITAQGSTAITSFTTNLTGTPVDGDTLRISVIGTGAVALTFGASFEASTIALPTTTVAAARLDVGFFWNTETSKWRCVGVA
jgi:hypothetical protein